MIRVIGANPAMDRVSVWPPIRLGEVNRARSVSVLPGGKGFNVARAAVRLGAKTTAHGFLGGRVGEALRPLIVADGVIDRHTTIAAGTRVCFIVVEPEHERSTVLNEPGPTVSAAEVEQFLEALRDDYRPDDLVLLSGSLPDSVEPAVAGEIIAVGNASGARTMCDIHGASLRAAFRQRPWMVKCNRDELLGLIEDGEPDEATVRRHRGLPPSELAVEMSMLRERGPEIVVVTLGAEGALLADAAGVVHASVPQVEVVNATGSGDLLLAGLAVGIDRGDQPRDALILGAACGTAGTTHLPPELPPDFDPDHWIARISVEALEPEQ